MTTLSVTSKELTRESSTPDPIAVSVIIPVRNGAHYLRRTLPVLREVLPAGWEIVVVDDNSEDGSREVALLHADTVIQSRHRPSAPAARNAGAGEARGTTFVFLDADVRVTRHSLLDLVQGLSQPGTACTFGLYSEGRHLATWAGRFKNIWVRHTYLESPSHVRWMNTSMAAISKESFVAVGGFDGEDDWRQGGNDMDFGRRVDETLGRVTLLHQVECDHLKEMTLKGLLRNDFNRTRGFFRTALFSREIRKVPERGYGNISFGFIGGVLMASWVPLSFLLTPLSGLFPLSGAAALGLHAALGARFYAYALSRIGRSRWAVPPVLFAVHLACAAGLLVEAASLLTRRRESAVPGTAADAAQARADVSPAGRI